MCPHTITPGSLTVNMQPGTINPNLTIPPTFSNRDLILRKVMRAIACSIGSHLVILLIYIIFANINVFHPTEWIAAILNTFTYLSTWIFVVIFCFIIFAQCLICGKDYVLMTTYCSTRFEQFLHIFSRHNFLLLLLHIVIGGASVWQILAIIDSSLRNLTETCRLDQTCLVQDTFFLILSGIFMGFYYFIRVYISSRHLVFPVIQQKKFLQFRSNITVLFKDSLTSSIGPTFYYSLLYYFWGNQLESRFMATFNLDATTTTSSFLIYVYCWWFGALYFFSMNLMRFFFYLFLTEPVSFPLVTANPNILTLQEALKMDSLPIMQNLACLDLYLLAQWSPLRRQLVFSLSEPGGHPHTWIALVASVMQLFTDYINLLRRSTEPKPPPQPAPQAEPPRPFASPFAPELRYRNLRNMSLFEQSAEVVDVSPNAASKQVFGGVAKALREQRDRVVGALRVYLGINFLFGELPQANVQKCLGNGQLVVWASRGISELAAASLKEDRYGIVQGDLPVIISTLVELKQCLDKLSKVPALTKKVDDFNCKMKNAVSVAVRQSLFNLCLHFGDYFNDFRLTNDVLQYLHVNVMLKNCN